MTLTTLVACGGGDGGLARDGNGDSTDTVISLVIEKITDGYLSVDNKITLTATLTEDSTPLANQSITFELTDSTIATFSPATGSVATNDEGIAIIIVEASAIDGAVEVTAFYDDKESDPLSFNSLGDAVSEDPDETAVVTLTLFSSTTQLASSGADTIELFAIVKDSANNLLEGATVAFAATSGQIQGGTLETSTDGKASVTLKTESEPSNRIITITATSGEISEQMEIEVTGTTVTLTGSSSLAIDDDNEYVIKLLDSDGDGIASTDVTLSLTNTATDGDVATITLDETVTTDFEGQATISVTGSTQGTNTLVASALGATANKTVSVESDSFLFSGFDDGDASVDPTTETIPDVLLSQTAEITLTWTRSGVNVADGTEVNFTTTRGTLVASSAMTVDGQVMATIDSTDAGIALVTFIGTDMVSGESIELSNQLQFEFVADNASTLIAQASPYSIGPGGQTSTISVTVRDDVGNLVKSKVIDFVLSDVSGGSIFPASATTDSSGSASTVYTSSSVSAQDAVAITAKVNDTSTVNDTVNLTVADRELFITLGTGNTLQEPDETTYIKEFIVQVVDVDSAAVEGVELTISAVPETYYKGFWYQLYDGNDFIGWVVGTTDSTSIFDKFACANEDKNIDGILDDGEDTNVDGVLTPGNIVIVDGSVTTDSDGFAVIEVRYGQSYGQFVDIKLRALAQVSGSESSAQAIFTLPILSTDVLNEDTTPPTQGIGTTGPFGEARDCTIPD
jgi:hypothetical protein